MRYSDFLNDPVLVQEAFGTTSPTFTHMPHCIIESTKRNLELVLDALGIFGGIFGEDPPFDKQGGYFLGPEDGRVIDDFSLWREPINQNYLLSTGYKTCTPAFKMVIDSATPKLALTRLHDHAQLKADMTGYYMDYHSCITSIDLFAMSIGWLFTPLANDCGFALVIFDHDHQPEFLKLRSAISSSDTFVLSMT